MGLFDCPVGLNKQFHVHIHYQVAGSQVQPATLQALLEQALVELASSPTHGGDSGQPRMG